MSIKCCQGVCGSSAGGLELGLDVMPFLKSRNWSLVKVQRYSSCSTSMPHSLSVDIQQVNNVIFWMMLELRDFCTPLTL